MLVSYSVSQLQRGSIGHGMVHIGGVPILVDSSHCKLGGGPAFIDNPGISSIMAGVPSKLS